MNPSFPQRTLLAVTLACAMGLCLTLRAAHAETPLGVNSLAEAKADFEHDKAACRNHTVDEDKKTCMLEAQRAYGEARREAMKHGGKQTVAKHTPKRKPAAETNVNTSGTNQAPGK